MDTDRTKRLLDGIKNAGRSEVVSSNGSPVGVGSTARATEITLVNLNGSDDCCEPITVYLSATRENNEVETGGAAPSDFVPYLVARLEWGTDGYQNQADVDFVRGCALSVLGSFVRVKVALDYSAFVNPVVIPPIRVGATASYGVRPSHAYSPTRTLFVRTLGVGATSANLLIPAFARNVTLAWSSPTLPLPLYQVEILDSANNVISVRTAGGGADAGTQNIPLPVDAMRVRVVNAAAGPAQDFRLIFGLAL